MEPPVDTEESQNSITTGKEQSFKRIACDICRGRKVRCDRIHPVCGRCQRLGHKCEYTTHRKPDAVKPNICHTLDVLNERLTQAEAQLALTQRAIPHIGPSRNPAASTSDTDFDMWNHPSLDIDSLVAPPEMSGETFSMLDNGSLLSVVPSLSTNLASSEVDTTPDNVDLHAYYLSYFNYGNAAMPMVNRDRFFYELANFSHRPELQSLSYTIALLGATVSPEQVRAERSFYDHARHYLSIAESDDDAQDFNNLNMLQAVILLTCYEFRRTSFARAWLSLGRANRLAKMLGLHLMDQEEPAKLKPDFITPLPKTKGLAELEERRRSFWVLFAFDAHASIRTGSSMSIQEDEITTLLPQPGDYFDNELNVMMPSLSRATQIADKTLFSSFAGVILMANLHRRCHNHFQAFESHDSTDGSKYDYWRWHYYLDKELSFYANQLLDHVHPFSRLGDPMALCLHTYLSAIQITLHEHAIKIIQAENLPGSLETESHNQCINSALKVATYAQCTSQMQDTKFLSSTFLIWPFSLASQVILRHMKQSTSNAGEFAPILHQMWCIMQQLKDESGNLENLLETIMRELAYLGIQAASDFPDLHGGLREGRDWL